METAESCVKYVQSQQQRHQNDVIDLETLGWNGLRKVMYQSHCTGAKFLDKEINKKINKK